AALSGTGASTTPSVLSAIAASSITSSSAAIVWTTDQASDSQVEYGLTAAYGTLAPLNTTLVTAHVQTLTGLAAGTLCHYRVRSRDASGALTVSGDFPFTTLAVPVIPNPTNATTPGALRSYATIQSIGVEWDIAGDPNHNATVEVQYRIQGASTWKSALPLVRVDYNGANMLAGSILFLGIDIAASNIWLEGLTIRNQAYATFSINAPDDVVLTRSTFVNNHYNIFLQQGGTNWYITDNDITGDVDPASGSFDGEGIELN